MFGIKISFIGRGGNLVRVLHSNYVNLIGRWSNHINKIRKLINPRHTRSEERAIWYPCSELKSALSVAGQPRTSALCARSQSACKQDDSNKTLQYSLIQGQ